MMVCHIEFEEDTPSIRSYYKVPVARFVSSQGKFRDDPRFKDHEAIIKDWEGSIKDSDGALLLGEPNEMLLANMPSHSELADRLYYSLIEQAASTVPLPACFEEGSIERPKTLLRNVQSPVKPEQMESQRAKDKLVVQQKITYHPEYVKTMDVFRERLKNYLKFCDRGGYMPKIGLDGLKMVIKEKKPTKTPKKKRPAQIDLDSTLSDIEDDEVLAAPATKTPKKTVVASKPTAEVTWKDPWEEKEDMKKVRHYDILKVMLDSANATIVTLKGQLTQSQGRIVELEGTVHNLHVREVKLQRDQGKLDMLTKMWEHQTGISVSSPAPRSPDARAPSTSGSGTRSA